MDLSIVIPSYNEEANIAPLLERLRLVVDGLGLSYEIIFVNDGSRDGTAAILQRLNQQDSRIKIVTLSRNFGKEMALTAGLNFATGAAVIPMDADLQHPPEIIPNLLAEWRNGADVVIAVRRSRQTDSLGRRIGSWMFFKIFNRLSEISIVNGGGDFRLFDRQVVAVLNQLPERTRFLKGLYAWVGFRQATVLYDVDPRRAGRTRFNFLRLFHYSIDAVTSFSTFPLRVWSMFGTILIIVAAAYAAYVAIDVILNGKSVPGFASLLCVVVLLGGIQFLTLGILGEYVGRIMTEVKGRPNYVVREALGFEVASPDRAVPASNRQRGRAPVETDR